MLGGEKVDGVILKIDKETPHNHLEILFTSPKSHNKGSGYLIMSLYIWAAFTIPHAYSPSGVLITTRSLKVYTVFSSYVNVL